MSSQMEQFFKVLLCLVMVALLIGIGAKYLESNNAKFDVKDTVDTELAKKYGDKASYTDTSDIEDENAKTESSDSKKREIIRTLSEFCRRKDGAILCQEEQPENSTANFTGLIFTDTSISIRSLKRSRLIANCVDR